MKTQYATDTLEFRWTVSRGRDTYGYNICSLFINGQKVSACNGGGYDMQGTALGNYVASAFPDRLNKLRKRVFNGHHRNGEEVSELYGLTYHDPNFNINNEKISKLDVDDTFIKRADIGKTFKQAEKEGLVVDLARYRAWHRASNNTPTKRCNAPVIDGACGMSSVQEIMSKIGLFMQYVPTKSKNDSVYQLIDKRSKF